MLANIIVVGDEILIGQVLDTNSNWMGQYLGLNGIQVREINAVADSEGAILDAVERALGRADVVLMTGGLGPTKDDITKKTLAERFGMNLVYHEESFENIKELLTKFNRPVLDEYKLQCMMPDGAIILKNPTGTAPGMWFPVEGKVLVSMPGVPWEMKYLMENEVVPRLKKEMNVSPIAHQTILTVGIGETQLAAMIAEVEDTLPAHIKLAYLPSLGSVRLRLTARGADEAQLQKDLQVETDRMLPLLGGYVYGFGEETLEGAVGKLLKERGMTLVTAESCTGGYIAHRITSVSGSSEYFQGSIVSYSNDVKMSMLGVKPETLDAHGAVSEETVLEMAQGALAQLRGDCVIAVSGVAGPNGGTAEKPVGTVCFAIGNKEKIEVRTLRFGRDREKNIQLTSISALNLLRKFLQHHSL